MAKLDIGFNPLEEMNNEQIVVEVDKKDEEKLLLIKKYGREITSISKDIIDMIDYEDRVFINRLYDKTIELENNDLTNLIESIKVIGLINVVYLQKRSDCKYRIVSGLRRLLACKNIFDNGMKVYGRDKVVVFPEFVKEDEKEEFDIILERISIDENTKRVNLTILEQAYKLHTYAEENGKTIDDTAQFFNIGTRTAKRIIGSINYPMELKAVLNEIGIVKAEIINKLLKKESVENRQALVDDYKTKSKQELEEIYKRIEKKKREVVFWNTNKNNNEVTIKIRSKMTKEIEELIENFKKVVENINS